MSYVIRIVGLMTGAETSLDGKYLAEYDPSREGFDPDGRPMNAHVVVTDTVAGAKRFASSVDALAEWRTVSPLEPWRLDGKPNRPLTAFSIDVERVK